MSYLERYLTYLYILYARRLERRKVPKVYQVGTYTVEGTYIYYSKVALVLAYTGTVAYTYMVIILVTP